MIGPVVTGGGGKAVRQLVSSVVKLVWFVPFICGQVTVDVIILRFASTDVTATFRVYMSDTSDTPEKAH